MQESDLGRSWHRVFLTAEERKSAFQQRITTAWLVCGLASLTTLVFWTHFTWLAVFMILVAGVSLRYVAVQLYELKGIDRQQYLLWGLLTGGVAFFFVALVSPDDTLYRPGSSLRRDLNSLEDDEIAELLAWIKRFDADLAFYNLRLEDFPLESIFGAYIHGVYPEDFMMGAWKKLAATSFSEYLAPAPPPKLDFS